MRTLHERNHDDHATTRERTGCYKPTGYEVDEYGPDEKREDEDATLTST
jgi:hypothetical protein